MKKIISILLNLCLALFVTSAAVSLVDDTSQLLFGRHVLSVINGILTFLAILAALAIYGLMAFLPMIPKPVFLPIALFYAFSFLAVLPVAIYGSGDWSHRAVQLDWALSLGQLILGVAILRWLSGQWKLHWPLLDDKHLKDRNFSWLNLSVFALVNVFVLLPALVAYLGLCAAVALDHSTAGFLTLHPGGLTGQVRNYVRNDGKKIELVPMAHVADAAFYHQISRSFPTNAIILMEGVTDERNLLANGISYQRMAKSLGLTEQRENFKPRGKLIRADVDVDQFAPSTIDLLNVVMLIYANGVNAGTLMKLTQYSPPPDVQVQLFDDILEKRNQHLLGEIQSELPQSDDIIVPWGAEHMPELAAAILKNGFQLAGTEDYILVGFHKAAN